MKISPFNITYLYEHECLGVYFTEDIPFRIIDDDGKLLVELEPFRVYPVIHLSSERNLGIMLVDEENSLTFDLNDDSFEFIDMRSNTPS